MNCGDVVHRSTLDLVLRKEVSGPDWKAFALLAAVGLYLFAKPGVLPGFIDFYLLAPLQSTRGPAVEKADIKLGKKLGAGGFGSVYKGELAPEGERVAATAKGGAGRSAGANGSSTAVIVKKAKEFGEAEVWMNERMMRAAPRSVAEFLTAFDGSDDAPGPSGRRRQQLAPAAATAARSENIWLVWRDEGENTLWDLMTKRDFPYNLEPLLLERELRLAKGKRRAAITLRIAARNLLEALADCHATGIVHRDVKPQNMIISVRDKRLKLIDLGAAADLRIGINYAPAEYLLDPRYAPPQQYIMSTQTPNPPPKPVAALLSPVLWAMEAPDRFDMYSAGITLMQMAFPNLRNDNNLIAFNRRLAEVGFDLRAWRREETARYPAGLPKDLAEGFDLLDMDGASGWDLVCQLVTLKPRDRLTAEAALRHPWLVGPGGASAAAAGGSGAAQAAAAVEDALSRLGVAAGTVKTAVGGVLPTGLLEEALTHNRGSGLTEAQLAEEFGYQRAKAAAPIQGSQTVAWWQGRQSELKRKLEQRRLRLAAGLRSTIRGVGRQLGGAEDGGGAPNGGSLKIGLGLSAWLGGGNGRSPAANGNGKAAANGNGKVAANGNGRGVANGNDKGAANGKVGANGNARAAAEEDAGSGAAVQEKVFDLINVFGGRK